MIRVIKIFYCSDVFIGGIVVIKGEMIVLGMNLGWNVICIEIFWRNKRKFRYCLNKYVFVVVCWLVKILVYLNLRLNWVNLILRLWMYIRKVYIGFILWLFVCFCENVCFYICNFVYIL